MKIVNWFKNLGIIKKALVLFAAFVVGMTALAGIVSVADPEGFSQAQEDVRQAEAERKAQKAEEDKRKAEEEQARKEAEASQKAEDEKRKAEEEQARKDAEHAQKEAEASKKAQEDAQRKAEEAQAQKEAEAEKARQEAEEAASRDPLADLADATDVEDVNIEWNAGAEGDLLKITFPISDNFTAGMIRTGAQRDTMNILHALKESGIEYTSVMIDGTFPMIDEYGNSFQGTPLTTNYRPETVNAINYDEFTVQDRIWDLADIYVVHPDLSGTN